MENKYIFKQKVILIVGTPTEVYLQIIHFFLKAEAFVIAPVKSLVDLQKIKDYKDNQTYPKLITEITDVPDYEKATLLTETIVQRFGKIDVAISMFNFWHTHTNPVQVSCEDWFNVLEGDLNPFFVSAVVVLESMQKKKTGLLVHITDSSQFDQDCTKLTTVILNTKVELSRIFAGKAELHKVKYYHLWVQNIAPNNSFPRHSTLPSVTPEKVVEHIKDLFLEKVYNKKKVFRFFPVKIRVL